eukprot:scaffold7468_cov277-Pinguiococcus_pyrenoidosus.AAC.6
MLTQRRTAPLCRCDASFNLFQKRSECRATLITAWNGGGDRSVVLVGARCRDAAGVRRTGRAASNQFAQPRAFARSRKLRRCCKVPEAESSAQETPARGASAADHHQWPPPSSSPSAGEDQAAGGAATNRGEATRGG